MAYAAGVDVGSTQTKAVVVDAERRIVARALTETGANVTRAAENAFQQALAAADLREEEVEYVVGTGYGRYKVTFGDAQITEITCHARGAHFHFPATRTVIDMGGQDTKAIKVRPAGAVLDFSMNDKCAAGTGRFLSAAADVTGGMEAKVTQMLELVQQNPALKIQIFSGADRGSILQALTGETLGTWITA